MKNQSSRIKYFHPNSLQILKLDEDLSVNILITLYNKFDLNKRDIDKLLKNNKNLGVFLNLTKRDPNYDDDWKQFINLFFPKKKSISNDNNILVSKDYIKLLLLTERRVLLEDLKNLNKIIFRINKHIEEYNDKSLQLQKITAS